jgi:hypothetical protein
MTFQLRQPDVTEQQAMASLSERGERTTVPLCSSTMFRTIASPRPRPPWTRVETLSACQNGSKIRGRKSPLIP